MGSSSTDPPNLKGLDPTVGGLVWVRRRNGSWWPGQIMDAEEFPDNCLASPRSEVPIKLLGRDDTSVDWYNLEKSKRVKAFRCGDYDACIEKAKVSAANLSRKAAKYARREDAIICALELESSLLSKRQENNCSRPDKSDIEPDGDCTIRASAATCHLPRHVVLMSEEISSVEKNSNSAPEFCHTVIPCEEENKCNDLERHPTKSEKQRTSNDSEDDGSEGVKRMRGLDDLGKGSDNKAGSSGLNESGKQGGVLLKDLCGSNGAVSRDLTSGSRGDSLPLSFKKKRTKVVFHEFLKRKNRRRMLTKVLQCETLVTIPIIYDDFPNTCMSRFSQGIGSIGRSSGIESEEACENGTLKSSSGHAHDTSTLLSGKLEDSENLRAPELLDCDSENLFDVPLISEEFPDGVSPFIVPCDSLKPQVDSFGEHLSKNGQVEANNEPVPAISSSSLAAQFNRKMDKGASEWQLKGKRNSRHLSKNGELDSKRSVETTNMELVYPEEFSSPNSGGKANHSPPSGGSIPSDGCAYSSRSLPLHQTRFPVLPRYEIPDRSIRSTYPDSILFDVEIEVKASYRPHHVPYISLMSKLNGKAIIGHPITVEVLEDGECESLVDVSELYQTSESYQLDEEECYDEEELEEEVHEGGEVLEGRGDCHLPKKRLRAWLASHSHVSSSSSLSPCKKSLVLKSKKHNGSSGKKTRTLSSLTGSFRGNKVGKKKKNHHQERRKAMVQSLKSPAIACVPLKLVFSRINEALNGTRGANHIS